MSIPDPELDAAVEARDIGAVVDRLADRWSMPGGRDEWVLDMLMDGVPAEVDVETRANVRDYLRDNWDEIFPPDMRGEAS